MANTKSAGKRARQTLKRSVRNRSVLTRLRGMHRKVRAAASAEAGDVRKLISAIDKAAKNRTIHRNAANRRKSRLNRLLGSKSK